MLNKTILSYKTRSLAKNSQVKRGSISYDKAKNIGIIFSIDDMTKHEIIKSFVNQLKKDGKNVQVLAFLPKGKENYEFQYDFFTIKDITLWGNFTAEQVTNFANQSFDYLFYIDNSSNPIIRNILAMSKAKCRIGKFNDLDNQLCELMIRTENGSIQNLVNEMYRYTKILS